LIDPSQQRPGLQVWLIDVVIDLERRCYGALPEIECCGYNIFDVGETLNVPAASDSEEEARVHLAHQ
jgi:hypothetical protein